MALIPPQPVGHVPGSAFWNDWIEKLRTLVNGISTGGLNHNDLANVQGGSISERYHLSAAAATENALTRASRGVDTTDDIIVDDSAKGIVLKSPNAHYWRATISNAGTVTWTDLGTTKP